MGTPSLTLKHKNMVQETPPPKHHWPHPLGCYHLRQDLSIDPAWNSLPCISSEAPQPRIGYKPPNTNAWYAIPGFLLPSHNVYISWTCVEDTLLKLRCCRSFNLHQGKLSENSLRFRPCSCGMMCVYPLQSSFNLSVSVSTAQSFYQYLGDQTWPRHPECVLSYNVCTGQNTQGTGAQIGPIRTKREARRPQGQLQGQLTTTSSLKQTYTDTLYTTKCPLILTVCLPYSHVYMLRVLQRWKKLFFADLSQTRNSEQNQVRYKWAVTKMSKVACSLIRSLAPSLCHSPTHSHTHSLTLVHPFTHSTSICSFICPSIRSFSEFCQSYFFTNKCISSPSESFLMFYHLFYWFEFN